MQATDANGQQVTQTLTITVQPGTGGGNGGSNGGASNHSGSGASGSGTGNTGGNPIPVIHAPALPFVVAAQTVGNTGATIQKTTGSTSVNVDVPAGAFSTPEQLTVTTGVIGDLSHVITGLPGKAVAVVLGVNFDGAAPTMPITVTINNPSITKNTVLYKVGADGRLVPVKATVTDGKVIVSFTSDPDFLALQITSGDRVIVSAGSAMIVPALVQKDAGTDTTYMPIWYVMQMLKNQGIESAWDGHNWHLSTGKVTTLGQVEPGTGTMHVYVDGTLVQNVTGVYATDPSAGKKTTYMPIWYVQQVLMKLGIENTWDGTTWSLTQGDSTQ